MEIRKFFKQHEIATRVTIYISKPTITPLADTKIYNLDKHTKNIQINDLCDYSGTQE